MVENDPITQAAQTRADQIIAQARNECDRTKKDADDYILQSLTNLKNEMEKIMSQVQNGIQALSNDKPDQPES